MSQTALINRSLTTVKTELEFLMDANVITEELCDKIIAALPRRYNPDQPVLGVAALGLTSGKPPSSTDQLADTLKVTNISEKPPRAPSPAPPKGDALTYCEVLYDYEPAQEGDLRLRKGEKVAVLEHLSEDWWKGRSGSNVGIFPANYVKVIDNNGPSGSEKQSLAPPIYQQQNASVHSVSTNNGMQQPYHQQNYNPQQGYSSQPPFPPPSTGYYQQPQQPQQQTFVQQEQPQQQPQQQQQSHHGSDAFKRFGSKLGNAAIFGAGATLGGDLINSIF